MRTDPALIIFDVDGTLIDRASGQLLPGRREFFQSLSGSGSRIALATNQGGVGLRYWMEDGGFGEPEKYPSQAQAETRLSEVSATIGMLSQQCPETYICYAYQARSGNWSPTPAGANSDLHWAQSWRKPAPGMLEQAIADARVIATQTLMVGDRDEDAGAAKAAGCMFAWAKDFFSE